MPAKDVTTHLLSPVLACSDLALGKGVSRSPGKSLSRSEACPGPEPPGARLYPAVTSPCRLTAPAFLRIANAFFPIIWGYYLMFIYIANTHCTMHSRLYNSLKRDLGLSDRV